MKTSDFPFPHGHAIERPLEYMGSGHYSDFSVTYGATRSVIPVKAGHYSLSSAFQFDPEMWIRNVDTAINLYNYIWDTPALLEAIYKGDPNYGQLIPRNLKCPGWQDMIITGLADRPEVPIQKITKGFKKVVIGRHEEVEDMILLPVFTPTTDFKDRITLEFSEAHHGMGVRSEGTYLGTGLLQCVSVDTKGLGFQVVLVL